MLLTQNKPDQYQVWMPDSNKITTKRIARTFICTKAKQRQTSNTRKTTADTSTNETPQAKVMNFILEIVHKANTESPCTNYIPGQTQNNADLHKDQERPMRCVAVAGQKRNQRNTTLKMLAMKKRKEIVFDVDGRIIFVMMARSIDTPRNDDKLFPDIDGGDVTNEFEEQRKPHMKKALNAEIKYLAEKRKTAKHKTQVRPNTRPPRNKK